MSNFPRPTKEDAAKLSNADLDLIAQGCVDEVKHGRNQEELPTRTFFCDLRRVIRMDAKFAAQILRKSVIELPQNQTVAYYRNPRTPYHLVVHCKFSPKDMPSHGIVWYEIS